MTPIAVPNTEPLNQTAFSIISLNSKDRDKGNETKLIVTTIGFTIIISSKRRVDLALYGISFPHLKSASCRAVSRSGTNDPSDKQISLWRVINYLVRYLL